MSYSLYAYLVDLNKLSKAIGSKDASLLGEVKQPPAKEDRDEDEEDDEYEISSEQALRDLVMGNPFEKNSAHQYGYALEEICRKLGKSAPSEDAWSGIRWEVLEMTGADQLLKTTGSPVTLPPIDDFPTIGHLTAPQIDSLVAKLGNGKLITAAPSGRKPRRSWQTWVLNLIMDMIAKKLIGGRQRGPINAEDVREQLDEYEQWLRAAAAQKQGLVFFYY